MIESTARQLVGLRLRGPGLHGSLPEHPQSWLSVLITSTTSGTDFGNLSQSLINEHQLTVEDSAAHR